MEGIDIQTIIRDTVTECFRQRHRRIYDLDGQEIFDRESRFVPEVDYALLLTEERIRTADLREQLAGERALTAKLRGRIEELARIAVLGPRSR